MVNKRFEAKAQRHAREIAKKEGLYTDFIEEASKVYADALAHDEADISKLVRLYALVNEMRVVSSRATIDSADRAVRVIVNTFLTPPQSFRELSETLKNSGFIDPLQEFSEACRAELENVLGRR